MSRLIDDTPSDRQIDRHNQAQPDQSHRRIHTRSSVKQKMTNRRNNKRGGQ